MADDENPTTGGSDDDGGDESFVGDPEDVDEDVDADGVVAEQDDADEAHDADADAGSDAGSDADADADAGVDADVDGADQDAASDEVDGDDVEIVYELDDWASETRVLVDGLLNNQGIAHAWQGGTLVVRPDDEAAVDEIIDDVEITTVPALDPVADKLAYEVNGWTDEQRGGLAQALGAQGIPYQWDEVGDLLVLETDEDRVEEILDGIEFPDELDVDTGDGDDGLAAQNALSELFVSSDRLMHDARDHEGVLSLVDAARMAAGLPLPFGFERAVWDDIVARAAAISLLFESDVDDDDEIIEQATALRRLLRSYV